jgi:23S rRNA pseudouridine1911/1915/1917 synthase
VRADDKIELLDRPRAGPAAGRGSRHNSGEGGPLPFQVLHEDEDVMVIVKPAGLLTSTNEREKRPTVAAMLRAYLMATEPNARLGIIHRLDRDARGLLVFSKNNGAYEHLKSQFYHHTVERLYTAVVEGQPTPKSGTIENLLYELPTGLVVQITDKSKGQIAVTHYETLQTLSIPPSRRRQPPIELPLHDKPAQPWAHRSLLRVKLQTGRKHQIRAHFAARKTPIVGDPFYGPDPTPVSPLLLAATGLAFDHPRTGERMKFEINPPEEVTALFPPEAGDKSGNNAQPKEVPQKMFKANAGRGRKNEIAPPISRIPGRRKRK